MNTVIAFGLGIMGVVAVGGWIAISIITGTSSGTEVPISIISGLVGVLTGKNLAQQKSQSQAGETLGKIAETASEAQRVVNAVECIKNIAKGGKEHGNE